MIESAEMFMALLHSDDPLERQRAAHDRADESLWRDMIEHHPDLRVWVAHNRTVSLDVLRVLARDPNRHVRYRVVIARRIDGATLALLADDPDDGIRHHVARHRHTDRATLERLREDASAWVADAAHERLHAGS